MNNQSMQTESQGSLDSEAPLDQGNMSTHGGDPGVASSSPNNSSSQLPAKKPTRQWAAWTHQEEESFFTALRQVGKNFEKITCRVQSKNKDQVRHYYYRLVRRMNKLLGPELSLDAKNSKDTNAAMLRWWSLLEKYSCKASKLHLKPRRFKIFIEALEHQLLKDRKKNVRKRPSHGENCLAMAPSGVSSQNRETGLDNRQVKLVLVDSQNIQKLGPGKGSFKRNINIGVNRTNNKGELTIVKATRQRRKPGVSSSAAYRKWEKAAIAGVSLVADAAEHLERTMTDKEVDNDQGHKGLNAVEKPLLTLPSSQNLFAESNMHSSVKLKLQLFPIDDCTRRALEMDKHNPHLELTLSTRKKISSVLEHLNRKWGNSSAALGELMLFPYSAQKENLMNNQRWTQDSMVNAADVHAMVGSPSVFRLRYGWFSITTTGSLKVRAPVLPSRIPVEHNMHVENRKGQMLESVPVPVPMPVPVPAPSTNNQSEKLVNTDKAELTSVEKTHTLAHAFIETPKNMCLSKDPKDKIVESSIFATNLPWNRKETGNVDDLRLSSETALSAGEWADSLTNISVGDLLAEVPQNMDAGCIDPPVAESCRCLQQTPFSCDSFDAAIAAHLSRHQSKMAVPPTLASHSSSIWDAEETCDAFSFQKHPVTCAEVSVSSGVDSLGTCKQVSSGGMIEELTDARGDVEYSTRVDPVSSGGMIEELTDAGGDVEYSTCADPVSECPTSSQVMDNSVKNFSGLTDIYWPDSLGPLDLDIPSCRYHSEDFILGDSLGGLNRLIASSLDAFQNCSFFGSEKKEQTSAVGARETTSFADFKIGSEV